MNIIIIIIIIIIASLAIFMHRDAERRGNKMTDKYRKYKLRRPCKGNNSTTNKNESNIIIWLMSV